MTTTAPTGLVRTDAVALGDPDPWQGTSPCLSRDPDDDDVVCLAPDGHDGQHAATDGEIVFRVWGATGDDPVLERLSFEVGVGLAQSDDGRTEALNPGLSEAIAPAPCSTCGLPTIAHRDMRRKILTCGDTCRSRYYGERARRVATAVTLTCAGCGETMTGRADRRYCSSRCRQRAYRRRVTA